MDPGFRMFYDDLAISQRKVLAHIAKNGGEEILSERIRMGSRLGSAATTQSALAALDKKEETLISDAVATRRHVMQQLLEHAQSMKSESSKLKALELIGKAVGMFTDRVETKVEEVTTDQLKSELESHLKLLEGATKH